MQEALLPMGVLFRQVQMVLAEVVPGSMLPLGVLDLLNLERKIYTIF